MVLFLNKEALIYSIALFIGIMIFMKVGYHVGRKKHLKDESESASALDGVVFALLGLLLAFTFSNSVGNYAEYRKLLLREANDIHDMYEKTDLIPEERQEALRALLRQYAAARVKANNVPAYSKEEMAALTEAMDLHEKMWALVAQEMKMQSSPAIAGLVASSFDTMLGAYDELITVRHNAVPKAVDGLFFILSMFAALIAGHNMCELPYLPRMRVIIFALSVTLTVYMVFDLGTPGLGFFNPRDSNELLNEIVRSSNFLKKH